MFGRNWSNRCKAFNFSRTADHRFYGLCYGHYMTSTILSLSRRHVLGDIHYRCDDVSGSIPVYLAGDDEPVLIGYADQSLGHYSDAISFHLDSDEAKKLSTGSFSFSGTYEFSNPRDKSGRSRVKITSITLTGRKSYEKPVPKQKVDSEPE